MTKNKRILISILSVVFVAVMVIVSFSVFTVREVKADFSVTDGSNQKTINIQNELNKYNGKNILFVNIDEIKENIEKDPYLEVLEIEKSLPNVITLKINERQEVFTVKSGDKKYILSDEGIVLAELPEEYDQRKYIDLSLSGIDIVSTEFGGKIVTSDDVRFYTAVALAKVARLNDCVKSMDVQKIHDTNPQGDFQTKIEFKTYSGVDIELIRAEVEGETKARRAFEAYDNQESDFIKSSNRIIVFDDVQGNIQVQWTMY